MPIELAVSLWLLDRQLGLAFLAPAFVAFASMGGIFAIAKSMGAAQKAWIEGIQTRIDVTASMLSSMKPVKMLGRFNVPSESAPSNAGELWIIDFEPQLVICQERRRGLLLTMVIGFTGVLTEIIQRFRVLEVGLSTQFRRLLCVRVFFGKLSPKLGKL